MIAVYPGSFDPLTLGHLDLIKRSSKLFDKIVVAMPKNSDKKCKLPLVLREQIILASVADIPSVEVQTFTGLLVNWMLSEEYFLILRGIRDGLDMENEWRMANSNKVLVPEIETMFLATSPEFSHVSSTLVREMMEFGGDIKPFVPDSALKLIYQ